MFIDILFCLFFPLGIIGLLNFDLVVEKFLNTAKTYSNNPSLLTSEKWNRFVLKTCLIIMTFMGFVTIVGLVLNYFIN